MNEDILSHIDQHLECIRGLRADEAILESLRAAAQIAATAIKSGGKLLFCGNGGSAADAQHFAAEFVVRLETDRNPLPAIALTTDTSLITAAGNDYGFDTIFSRSVSALGQPGDVLIAISTSGNSPNVLKAAAVAIQKGLKVIALTGEGGGKLADNCDIILRASSSRTMRIQECHSLLLHIWCSLVESAVLA